MEKLQNKTLVIYDSIDYFIPFMEDENTDVVRLHKRKGLLITLIKKMYLFFGWFNRSWYADWIHNISDYSQIILFATKDYSIVRHLKRRSTADVHFWYWNPAFRMGIPRKLLFDLVKVWSFDPKDCEKYRLNFNSTFFFKGIKLPVANQEYDILFLGINKGRREKLLALNEEFNRNSLKTLFHIVPDKNEKVSEKVDPIPYDEYLVLLSKTNAILDLQPTGQSGLTLRPMESIFFKKKLITDNLGVLKEDFYDSQNIFILGFDDITNIEAFINSPYKEVDPEVVNYFDFGSWLKRFHLDG